MSKKSLESAIGKAILDNGFRNLLFAKPEEALAAFGLTSAEKNSLKRVDCETLELLAKVLKPRLHKNAQRTNFDFVFISRPAEKYIIPQKGKNK